MRTPLVPTIVVLFILGAVLGYGTLAAGPIAGVGLAGFLVLAHVVITCPSPSCHFDASTPLGMTGFGVIAIGGISLLAWRFRQAALRRRPFPPGP